MNLNQLYYFQKVATLQHYHQAAEKLNISQPSLSRSISNLEEELGLKLFVKKGRNIELIKRELEDERDIYEDYAKRTSAAAMLYLRDDQKIEMVNLRTGDEKLVNIPVMD